MPAMPQSLIPRATPDPKRPMAPAARLQEEGRVYFYVVVLHVSVESSRRQLCMEFVEVYLGGANFALNFIQKPIYIETFHGQIESIIEMTEQTGHVPQCCKRRREIFAILFDVY